MPSPRNPPRKPPLKLSKAKLLASKILTVRNLTADSGNPKRVCTFQLRVQSPMGPECGGLHHRFDIFAKVANKIAPGGGK